MDRCLQHQTAGASEVPFLRMSLLAVLFCVAALSVLTAATRHQPLEVGPAESAEQVLQTLNTWIDDFNGVAGVYVRNLKTGEELMVNPDTVFPTASMIKVPIMGKIFQDMEHGKFAYAERVPYDTIYSYRFTRDMINQMPHGSEISLSRLIYLMVCVSDNTSSIWLQAKAGGGLGINEWLAGHGFEMTRVNSRTEGRQEAFRRFGWGQTTPREMTELMVRIFEGNLVSPLSDEKMYRIMRGNLWDTDGLSQIPPYVNYASKGGAVRRSRSETVVVNAPSGDYAYTVITKKQEDERYDYDNEGYVLKRKVGRLLWNYFEPDDSWEPNPDYPKAW